MKKLNLISTCISLILGVILAVPVSAQRNIKAELKKDVVQVENGFYSIEEYGLVTTFDKDFNVKLVATAPVSLLSRDYFVRYYGAFSSSILSTWLRQEGIKTPDDLVVILKEKPSDQVDITVTITMTEKGVDYVVETENSKSKMNIQWQYQLFTDPPVH